MARSQNPPSPECKKRGCTVTYACKVWCMITVCVLLVAAAVVLVYVLLTKQTANHPDNLVPLPTQSDWSPECPSGDSSPMKPEDRFDCFPDDDQVERAACEARGCCFLMDETARSNGTARDEVVVPVCVYPLNYGYVSSGKATPTFNGFELSLRRLPVPSRYGDDIQTVRLKVEMQTKYRLHVKLYDANNNRFEVPSPQIPVHSPSSPEQNEREMFLYSVTYDVLNKPFTLKVRRSSSESVVFDTSAGALSFANQFLELTTKVPSSYVYGLGQYNMQIFQQIFNWDTRRLFSSKSKYDVTSGVHPMYMCLEKDGNAHGVLLVNSNAMEIQLHPSPAVTYRTTGGILDFYIFLGPTPEDVIQQYTEAVGRPALPPYWSLGFHIGRSSYTISEIEKFMDGFKGKHIPMESLVLTQDSAMNLISKGKYAEFSNFSSKFKSKDHKLILQLPAGVPKEAVMNRDSMYSGSLQELFVTDKWGWQPIEGQHRNKAVIYPDFGNSESIVWWNKVIKKIYSTLGFDGLWMIDNEPASSVDGSSSGCLIDDLNSPPYVPGPSRISLYHKTLCMDALLHWKSDMMTHYDSHNLYGHLMALTTENALTTNFPYERKLILSDSTFVGSGQFVGHNIKAFEANWEGLRSSVKAVLEYGLHGIPLTGAARCENSEELCLRWLQCSIFFPLLLLEHSGTEFLYNAGQNDKEMFHAVRNAVLRRYELLPQLYTLFYLAHVKGSTVVRPLFHNFPKDNETYSISSQFMWGSSLLISPILNKGIKALNFYLPEGIWYDFYQGGPIYSRGEWFTERGGLFEDSKQPAVMHIQSGHIITLQKPGDTTSLSRQNFMSILVALNEDYEAQGLLYWDDGNSRNSLLNGEYLVVDYLATKDSLTVSGHFGKKVLKSSFYKAAIEQVRIMGLRKPPKRIVIDGSYILSNKQYKWDYDTMVLDLKLILIPLGRKTELKWFY